MEGLFEQSWKNERTNCVMIWGERILVRANSKCKSPEAGTNLACSGSRGKERMLDESLLQGLCVMGC